MDNSKNEQDYKIPIWDPMEKKVFDDRASISK